MKGDFGSMIWVNDKEGHEYVCTVDKQSLTKREFESLTDDEKKSCMDVNQFVGTERW